MHGLNNFNLTFTYPQLVFLIYIYIHTRVRVPSVRINDETLIEFALGKPRGDYEFQTDDCQPVTNIFRLIFGESSRARRRA